MNRPVKAAKIEPGQSIWDPDHAWRSRLVYSVEKVTGEDRLRDADGKPVPTLRVRWGHPDQPEPLPLEDGESDLMPADRDLEIVDNS